MLKDAKTSNSIEKICLSDLEVERTPHSHFPHPPPHPSPSRSSDKGYHRQTVSILLFTVFFVQKRQDLDLLEYWILVLSTVLASVVAFFLLEFGYNVAFWNFGGHWKNATLVGYGRQVRFLVPPYKRHKRKQ
jgi:hypothetical protein